MKIWETKVERKFIHKFTKVHENKLKAGFLKQTYVSKKWSHEGLKGGRSLHEIRSGSSTLALDTHSLHIRNRSSSGSI